VATRKPLVQVYGSLGELPGGDTVNAPDGIAGGSSGLVIYQGSARVIVYALQTNAVSTAPVAISAPSLGECFFTVTGADLSSNRFQDQVVFSYSAIGVVHSQNIFGNPPSRTYTLSGGGDALTLQMGSGTYDIRVFGFCGGETH